MNLAFLITLLGVSLFFSPDLSSLVPLRLAAVVVPGAGADGDGAAVHVVFTLCGGPFAGSKTAGNPGPTAVKSVLLSALMQRGDLASGVQSGGTSGSAADPLPFSRLHLHLVLDDDTLLDWRDESSGDSDSFRDVKRLLRRNPRHFNVTLWSPRDVWREARVTLEAEARARGGEPPAPRLDQEDLNPNMWKLCAGLRLLYPMAFHSLGRFVYLDFDTVTLCDLARLGAEFRAFGGASCFGFAGEDPSGGRWPSWYDANKLPVGTPGGVNTGVMLVDAQKLSRVFTLRKYWLEVVRILGEGIYHSIHGKYYGSDEMPSLGDQDVLNVLFYNTPTLLHVLSPRWNTMQPAGRIRTTYPDFVPPPPCVLHYTAGSFGTEKHPNALGNGAFRFMRDWHV